MFRNGIEAGAAGMWQEGRARAPVRGGHRKGLGYHSEWNEMTSKALMQSSDVVR